MAYKGEDLDLMTPRGWGLEHIRDQGRGRAMTMSMGYRNSPSGRSEAWLTRSYQPADDVSSMWVDEPVMRCCNQAYDLAVVHRAKEVGPEHLLHAMTLAAESIEVLRDCNINVTTLRQESAAMMAASTPLGYGNGRINPRNSEEFIKVLRLAAERAYAHRSPVTTEDILDTLFDMKSDHSSRNLLSRHRADWRLRTNPDIQVDEDRDRLREAPTVTDSFQNTRIDALERMVHELSGDIADNRQTFAELIEELRGSRGTLGRSDPPRISSRANGAVHQVGGDGDGVVDRLYAMERNVEAKFDELVRAWDVLGKRLDGLEEAVESVPQDGGAIEVDELSAKTADALGDKLKDLSGIQVKVEELDELGAKIGRLESALGNLPERLIAMERRLASRSGNGGTAPVDLGPVTARLGALEKLIEASPDGNIEIAPLMAALGGIEQRVDDTRLVADGMAERLDRVDTSLDSQRHAIADTVANAVAARLTALEAKSATEMQRVLAAVGNVDEVDSATHDALIKLNTNQQTLASAFDQWRVETKSDANAILQRLQLLETSPKVPEGELAGLQQRFDDLAARMTQKQDFWTRFRIWLYGTDDWYGASWGKRRDP